MPHLPGIKSPSAWLAAGLCPERWGGTGQPAGGDKDGNSSIFPRTSIPVQPAPVLNSWWLDAWPALGEAGHRTNKGFLPPRSAGGGKGGGMA